MSPKVQFAGRSDMSEVGCKPEVAARSIVGAKSLCSGFKSPLSGADNQVIASMSVMGHPAKVCDRGAARRTELCDGFRLPSASVPLAFSSLAVGASKWT
jgi:hypothetical protein